MENCDSPHRRFNPLIKSWVLVSPHRINRPWQGKVEKVTAKMADSESIPKNPLQPNAVRSNGAINPDYKSIYLFKNDFPALLNTDSVVLSKEESNNFNFFRTEAAKGDCFVMCFHPLSKVTLATMHLNEVITVIKKWASIIESDSKTYEWIQIFENRGDLMGCSNPHPHCQIWSTKYLPSIPSMKNDSQLEYFKAYRSPMLHDYVNREIAQKKRIVCMNDSWVCVVPFWAEWPFETMILPRRVSVRRLNDLLEKEVENLAQLMQILLKKYNNLFNIDFPYSMGWHGAPTGSYMDRDMSHWTLHAIYYPPLLRSATVKKFFVGFELLAESQRDLTPEKAAEILQNVEI